MSRAPCSTHRQPRQPDLLSPAINRRQGSRPRRRIGNRRGATLLILVFVVVVILSLAGYTFVASLKTAHRNVRMDVDQSQLEQAVLSAQELLTMMAQQPPARRALLGGLYDNPEQFRNRSLSGGFAEQAGDVRFTVLTRDDVQGPYGHVRYGMSDHSARLHLGRVVEWERMQPGSGRAALLSLPGVTESLADALLEWTGAPVSTSDRFSLSTAHRDVVPVAAPGSLPTKIEELLFVPGMTRELLLGADSNRNWQIDPEEESRVQYDASTPGMQVQRPLADLITLWSAESNRDAQGNARINLNQLDLQQLHRQLTGEFGEAMARWVVLYRQHGPGLQPSAPRATENLRNGFELRLPPSARDFGPRGSVSGWGGQSDRTGGTGSGSSTAIDWSAEPRFMFTTPLDAIGATAALAGGSSVPSPISSDPGDAAAELDRWLDRTTTSPLDWIEGRVNIELAPPEVLAAIPQMPSEAVSRIVNYRQIASGANNAVSGHSPSPIWLWREGLVDLETLKRMWPNITSRGDVLECQIVAWFEPRGPWRRVSLVLDASNPQPARKQWLDLTPLGVGFARPVLTGEESDR